MKEVSAAQRGQLEPSAFLFPLFKVKLCSLIDSSLKNVFPLAVWWTFDDELLCVCVSFEWFGRWFECVICMWVFQRRPIIQFMFLCEVVFKEGKVLVV